MSDHEKQAHDGLQERNQDASPVLPTSSRAQADDSSESKPVLQSRGENTGNRPGRLSAHSVFVLAWDGTPLTPTTPAKARKLLKHGGVKKVWSKFGTFGIQILYEVRRGIPRTALGVDPGTKFEGYSVVVDKENNLNVKLDLHDKKGVRKKLEDRKELRRARRKRKLRRRPSRFKNRRRNGFLAPSHRSILLSRLKITKELCRIYPIQVVGYEKPSFHSPRNKFIVDVSNLKLCSSHYVKFLESLGMKVTLYTGQETFALRNSLGYRKERIKSSDCFESHCSDSLSLAIIQTHGYHLREGLFLSVDDTYRPVRRSLHDAQPREGGTRGKYSSGSIRGLRKGLLVGTPRGEGKLCGLKGDRFRYYGRDRKRSEVKKLKWIKSAFFVK